MGEERTQRNARTRQKSGLVAHFTRLASALLTRWRLRRGGSSIHDHGRRHAVRPNDLQALTLFYDRLTPEHLEEFKDFSCGEDEWHRELDEFLRDDALREGDDRLSTTYVFYDQAEEPVAFATLSTSEIRNEETKGSPRLLGDTHYRSIPALLIGRLAVDSHHQGKRYGSTVLAWIREMALSLPIGCRFLALHVDKPNEAAARFYSKWGFFKPPYVKAHHSRQLMLYDLVGSAVAPSPEASDPA